MFRPTLFLAAALLGLTASIAQAANTLTWMGCSVSRSAFMEKLASAYELKTGIRIELKGGADASVLKDVADQKIHIGSSARHAMTGQGEAMATIVPVAWDGLAVVIHPSNPVADITLDQLRAIHDGTLTDWSALGGAPGPIKVLVLDNPLSGLGYNLRRSLFGKSDSRTLSGQPFADADALEQAVANTPLALAVTGASAAGERGLRVLTLNGVEPTAENIAKGNYPLYQPLYLAVNKTNPDYADIQRFVDFAVSPDGRQLIRLSGAVPYFDAIKLVTRMNQDAAEALN